MAIDDATTEAATSSEDKTDGVIEMEMEAAVHQPRTKKDDEVDPEGIHSHGEVSEKERGRDLVRLDREKNGSKNCKRRRGGIGQRRKREIRDQQFNHAVLPKVSVKKDTTTKGMFVMCCVMYERSCYHIHIPHYTSLLFIFISIYRTKR